MLKYTHQIQIVSECVKIYQIKIVSECVKIYQIKIVSECVKIHTSNKNSIRMC